MPQLCIGEDLYTASVKIIDQTAFPSDRVRDDVRGGHPEKIEKVPPFLLLAEFIDLCRRVPVASTGTLKTIGESIGSATQRVVVLDA